MMICLCRKHLKACCEREEKELLSLPVVERTRSGRFKMQKGGWRVLEKAFSCQMGLVNSVFLARTQKEKILANACGKGWSLVLLHWGLEYWIHGGKCAFMSCEQGAGRSQRM